MVLSHWRKLGDVDLFTSCEYMLQIVKVRDMISEFVSSSKSFAYSSRFISAAFSAALSAVSTRFSSVMPKMG